MINILLLLFTVVELKITRLSISSNHYLSTSTIKNVMLTKKPDILHRGIFNQDIFNGDLTAIENLYRSNGFLEVNIDHKLTTDSMHKKIEIDIDIMEGKQTFIETIKFTGNSIFNDSILKEKIITQPGEPFDRRRIDLDNYIITSVYDDIGYADASVKSDYNITDHRANIIFTISECNRQFVQNIELTGLRRTRKELVYKEIIFKNGDVFRYANVLNSQRNLYNLGVFKTVKAQIKLAPELNHKIVQFSFTERKVAKFYFRVGYGTRDYLRLGAGVKHINLFGRAWQGTVDSKLSFAEYRLTTNLFAQRILSLPLNSSIGAFYQYKKEISFNMRRLGGNLTGHFDLLNGTFSTKYEVEQVRTSYSDQDSISNDWLQGISLNWFKDRRNDPLLTRSGDYVNVLFETSGVIFPSDIDYIKPLIDYRNFKPINSIIAALSLKFGIVQPISPTLEIPVYKRFYCGGTSSVRGYSEWSIGPKDAAGNPLGGRILVEISSEFRFPLYKILNGVVFLDAGNAWHDYSDIKAELRYGIGAGIRLKTPLGSIRLDYGFKLNRQTNESPGALHFAIGEAF